MNEKIRLQKLLAARLGLEYVKFQNEMLQSDSSHVFSESYKIDITINIYETLNRKDPKTFL